ncbi:hypothetical protein C660_11867 [Alcaligenes sp. HPC1271]|uniref:hypothetical protein n=1 Tax=Alcaligenes sp. EGD-AK7 TaxID=1386079 RepID=UPI0002AA72E7|nr:MULTISPECIES: hypothetical protein [unclassified Alcaligenes]EKU29889.1 hypothetical protein C660_11867 [Alcaligenes sp. HPC1271]
MELPFDDSTPAVWQHEFTVENLIDYATASRCLSEYIRVLNKEGYTNLVIPSRGAVPFVQAATRAYMLESNALQTPEERYRWKVDFIYSPFTSKLVLPFSADPNEEFQTSGAIREYWSRVLAAIIKRDGRDKYLVLYKVLVEKLAKRSWNGTLGRVLPTKKFIFVDTVISGRAICEIITAFKKVGLEECYFILIADESGNKIEPEYRQVIEGLIQADRCSLIHVKRMFTEDRGPGASGVWSTVYPQVLRAVQQNFPWAEHCYGAGTFYHKVSSAQLEPKDGIGTVDYNMPVTQMYSSIKGCIFAALVAMQQCDEAKKLLEEKGHRNLPNFDSLVADYRAQTMDTMMHLLRRELDDMCKTLRDLEKFTPLDKRTTKLLAEPRVKKEHPNAEVEVSSSHLVRVILPEAEVDAFIHEAKIELSADLDVLADDYFH